METGPDSESGSIKDIDITVKTLDGQNRKFTVPENINVRQFKEKISGTIEVAADTQRLIFQGRVMQDEKVLKDYDIHGKVIHLVQRAPPSTLTDSGTSTSTPSSAPSDGRQTGTQDGNLFDVQIHVGRVQQTPNSREARARIRQAEFNLGIINDALNLLEQRTGISSSDLPQADENETPRPSSGVTVGQSEESMDTSPDDDRSVNSGNGSQRLGNSESTIGGTNDQQGRGLQATELADFLDRVLCTSNRMAPHLRLFRNYLRNEENYPPSSQVSRNAQEVTSRVMEAIHAMSHMMHSLSDVMVDMQTDIPRQVTAMPPAPFSVPGTTSMAIPIHMNVRARHNANGNRQRSQGQSNPTTMTSDAASAATHTSATSENSSGGASRGTGVTTTGTSNTASSSAGMGSSPFQMPPGSLQLPPNLATAGDPTVMLEVYPGVTLHDIRAVVTEGEEDEDEGDTDTANITVVSSTTVEATTPHMTVTTTTSNTASTASTPCSTAPPPPPSTPRTTASRGFSQPNSNSSTSTFTFGPTTSVNVGGMPNIPMGQMPNVPGLPPGMLQNILGSILNTHGLRPGQPFQFNVVQQTTAGMPGGGPRPPQPPQGTNLPQQPVQDLPLDGERSMAQHMHDHLHHHHHHVHTFGSGRLDASHQTPASMDASTATRANVATNTIGSSPNAATSISSSTSDVSSGNTNVTVTTSFNIGNNVGRGLFSSSSIGTRTDPNMGTSSRSTNTPRPHFHIHRTSPAPSPRGPTPTQSRSVNSGGNRGYMDPYLPCSSVHYSTQTARAQFRNIQNQTQSRGQQSQQQVPNLSTMVSGMVGNIIEQVGQAAQQARSNGSRTSATTSTATTASSSTTTATGGVTRTSTRTQPTNPLAMLSTLFSGGAVGGGGGQVGPPAFDIGAMLGNMMQARPTPASGSSTAPSGNTQTSSAPAGGTLADLFTHFRPMVDDGGGEPGNPNVVVALLEAIAPHMGLTDLFSLVMGNTRVLSQLRGPLREFVGSRVAQHGSVEAVVELALEDMYPEIQHIESFVEVKDDVDMAQSIRNCLKRHLTKVFTHIHSEPSGLQEEFGRQLYALWMKMMEETIGLCVYCIKDGQAGFSTMVQRYMPRMTQGMNPAMTIWMTTSLQEILGSFHQNHPVAVEDIIGYVSQKSARARETSSASRSELQSAAIPGRYQGGVSSSLTTNSTTTGMGSPPSPMDIEGSPSSKPPKAKVARTVADEDSENNDIFEDAQESFSSRPVPLLRSAMIQSPPSQADGAVGDRETMRNGSSDDWQSVIPQEWIPVINQDIVRQQEQRSQPPLSDAYLQGLPAKRRRMMTLEHAGEMGNMSQYLPASLSRAARAAGIDPISSEENLVEEAADNLDLQVELAREVNSVLEARISNDSDFRSDKFPNAKEYFHKSKRH